MELLPAEYYARIAREERGLPEPVSILEQEDVLQWFDATPPEAPQPVEKRCPGCQHVLPMEQYYRNRSSLDGSGYQLTCKSCGRARSRAHYARNRERLRLASKLKQRAYARRRKAEAATEAARADTCPTSFKPWTAESSDSEHKPTRQRTVRT